MDGNEYNFMVCAFSTSGNIHYTDEKYNQIYKVDHNKGNLHRIHILGSHLLHSHRPTQLGIEKASSQHSFLPYLKEKHLIHLDFV